MEDVFHKDRCPQSRLTRGRFLLVGLCPRCPLILGRASGRRVSLREWGLGWVIRLGWVDRGRSRTSWPWSVGVVSNGSRPCLTVGRDKTC
jgi:hypothetical protein